LNKRWAKAAKREDMDDEGGNTTLATGSGTISSAVNGVNGVKGGFDDPAGPGSVAQPVSKASKPAASATRTELLRHTTSPAIMRRRSGGE
jgi:hypothetical protein